MKFLNELKQRNVIRVAITYVVVAWVLLQGVDFVLDVISTPDWVIQVFVLAAIAGFPIVMLFSWIFEITPEGIKRESEIDHSKPVGQNPTTAVPDSDRSVAVLPFVNMSSDPEQAYSSDGLTEELLNRLAQHHRLRVAARTSSFQFKGKSEDISKIAEQLKVAYVLEGSVRKSGDKIRVTAQLVKADSGYHVWSQTFERKMDDVFAIQDDISSAIISELGVAFGAAPYLAAKRPTESLPAYQLYLQARYLVAKRGGDNLLQAIKLFKQALELDPNFANAWSALAFAYVPRRAMTPTPAPMSLFQAHTKPSAKRWNSTHRMPGLTPLAVGFRIDSLTSCWKHTTVIKEPRNSHLIVPGLPASMEITS